MTRQSGGPKRRGTASTSALPDLDVKVDRTAEIPIGVQLAWALRTRIRDGELTPRQRLPGLREVAEATGVNVNTVRAVFQRLEQEGLIDSQQGSGTFVASQPPSPSAAASIAADAAREAHETGVDPREVAAALYVAPASTGGTADEQAERRRGLREQIAALERTLGELEAKHPGVAPRHQTSTHAGIGPALLRVRELEDVRATLVRRLSAVQTAIDQLVEARTEARESPRRQRQPQAANTKPKSARGAAAEEQPPARSRPTTRPAPAGA